MHLLNSLQAHLAEDWQKAGFGLYLHWPFCEAKCPYCDFNSHVAREIDQSRWLEAYMREIDRYARLMTGRVLNSVFFGGGTPSLMSPDIVAALLEEIRKRWPVSNDLEVTLEANPGSVEAGRFKAYAEGGVSRISMGIQALNDADLHRLGRKHSVAEAKQAFDVARCYFDRVSFDLIYARQDQTVKNWKAELTEALSMSVDHLSLYQLTIEEGTAFGDRYAAGKLRGIPHDDVAADMFQITQEVCEAAGFPAYEISNHARIGAESRHNLIYWRYGDYIGIGPGAHGRITIAGKKHATEAWSSPNLWLKKVDIGRANMVNQILSQLDQANEYLLMGLRLIEGIDLDRFSTLAGCPLSNKTISQLEEIGTLAIHQNQIRATQKGRMMLNAVIRELSLSISAEK